MLPKASLFGVSPAHINAKLSDIIEFSELSDKFYHPVATYSYGMMVRRTFSVIACFEPELLIVDEPLPVGDFAFQ